MSDLSSGLIIVSGPSGAGKDTIVGKLIELDSDFSLSVSATTRAPRGGEKDGVDYYFYTEDEFAQKIRNGEFVEYAKYGSKYYGTLKSDVKRRIDSGKTVILVIEVHGAENVKRLYPDALSVFIMPPSEAVLEQRLRRRCTDSDSEIARRMDIAKNEIKQSGNYDYTVVNDELEKAVGDVYKIIKNHKCKTNVNKIG